ncbi:MAG: hypothetical protein WBV82_04290 [Myxococcaceae bacterium]
MARDGDQKSSFDRDFGYLLPFMDRVEAAAADLTAPGAADELRRLMSGEKAKWARIRELLVGSVGGQASQQAVSPTPAPAPTPTPTGFTIGSLRSLPVRPAKDRLRDG